MFTNKSLKIDAIGGPTDHQRWSCASTGQLQLNNKLDLKQQSTVTQGFFKSIWIPREYMGSTCLPDPYVNCTSGIPKKRIHIDSEAIAWLWWGSFFNPSMRPGHRRSLRFVAPSESTKITDLIHVLTSGCDQWSQKATGERIVNQLSYQLTNCYTGWWYQPL